MSLVGDRRHAELRRRYEALLDRVQNPARLVGGEPGAGPGYSCAPGELRVVLGFPDSYEIGIANQALQILYHLASQAENVGVERVYLPWVDVIGELRGAGLPLVSLETWTPIREAHLIGLSLQHELNFTNVLEMLDLGSVPLRRESRGEEDPLVIGGGPAVANFTPMEPFFDAFVIGDAEESFLDVLSVAADGLEHSLPREERRRSLAGIEGVYVPDVSRTVARRVVEDLSAAPYPSSCIVPVTAGVHDRGWIEVMRGCTRGCRFCQAGMWYRPVRERPPGEVVDMAAEQLDHSGYQELSLASLSSTDYTGLGAALADIARCMPEARVNLPSLRVDSAAVRLGHVTSPGGSSVTLAPEAGSARVRDVINKNVSEEDVLEAAREAFRLGKTTVKLYFMIGLPTEEDEDVEAVVALVRRVAEAGRQELGDRRGRLRVHVSATNFIPKAATPFQWFGMADRQTLARRQRILERGIRGPGMKLSLHDIDDSFLEAALARGGPELGDVIERAWRMGAAFDSWSEAARPDAWARAFEPTGVTAEALATTPIPDDGALPWDVIEHSVERDFLLRERDRALEGRTTADCRTGACSSCGACPGSPTAGLAAAAWDPRAEAPRVGDPRQPAANVVSALAGRRPAAETPASSMLETRPRHVLLTFSATGRARYLGHLDTAEALRRAVRRAGGRLALSRGIRPKPLLTVVLPRPVGVRGARELCEFELAEVPSGDFSKKLDLALPDGFRVVSLDVQTQKFKAASRVRAAAYRVTLDLDRRVEGESVGPAAEARRQARLLEEAARRYTRTETALVVRDRAGKRREIDVRAYVDDIAVRVESDEVVVVFTADVTPHGTVRAEEVVEVLARVAGISAETRSIERTEILLEQGT